MAKFFEVVRVPDALATNIILCKGFLRILKKNFY